ncbi:restriction system-associated AAA family ATPase [compost metagenome]
MFFQVVRLDQRMPSRGKNRAYLIEDRWDDWGKYRTQFRLVVADEAGESITIGEVKIGHKGLRSGSEVSKGVRAPKLSPEFDQLDEGYFSLGQGEAYYESLNGLSESLKSAVLTGLRDCASDPQVFAQYRSEEVMTESLLRDVTSDTVRTRLHRLTRGDARLTKYRFKFDLATKTSHDTVSLGFNVIPDSMPPTNVHVLIGRNGVGKTQCMRNLTLALLGRQDAKGKSPGKIEKIGKPTDDWAFAGIVHVSFSAFDSFDLTPEPDDLSPIKQVGLRYQRSENSQHEALTSDGLAREFAKSLNKCKEGLRADRWKAALEVLEVDDLFAEANVESLLDLPFDKRWSGRAERLFKRLSSGHAVVLLTITRLIELVDERTLVLLDEPEGHLHPPLLSAFIRALSDLLVRRNGVAIIATHSPVVLQEVPRSCAWKLRRSGTEFAAERPTIETFGEGVGVLTREVFGLEVTRSGFHRLIEEYVAEGRSYPSLVDKFDDQLGSEAKAIARALVAERDLPEDDEGDGDDE